MQRHFLSVILLAFVASCEDRAIPTAATRTTTSVAAAVSATGAVIDPALTAALSSATSEQQLEVIATYDASATTGETVASAVSETGAGVVGFNQLPMVAALATAAQVNAIATTPGVTSVYLNKPLRYLLAESVASIKADQVRVMGITGKGVGVAILDSGIDGLYNPDLKYPEYTTHNIKAVFNLADVVTFKGTPLVKASAIFSPEVANSESSVGHGTHVAGIVGSRSTASGGKYRGVAPDASLIGIGTGDVLFIFWALAGFDYVLEHQAEYNIKVVNNSWGTSGAFDPHDPINEATKQVSEQGVTVVFAAGNEGPGENTLNPYSVAPWVIGVAAGCKTVVDPTHSADHCIDGDGRSFLLADFSSRGIPGDPLYHPTVLAPGVHIVSTRASTGTVLNALDANHDASICNIDLTSQGYYTCASGTSMASPHVAGVVALMQEAAGNTLKPDEVKRIISVTAVNMPGYFEYEVGAGYVDAKAAVDCVRSHMTCIK
jgi:serine protease AprX